MQVDNNDTKLIEFCELILSHNGIIMNATEYLKKLGEALGREELKVMISDSVPQIILTKDEENRLQKAFGIAQQRTFIRTHENSKHRLDYDEYLKNMNYQN